jgi:uncharacterized protein YndB with AHSA1/START domain
VNALCRERFSAEALKRLASGLINAYLNKTMETIFTNNPAAIIRNERIFAASANQIFAAFQDPARLARWWGPAGFTNTFKLFEFRRGGRWEFVMHGPDGTNYPNSNVLREIEPDTRIVIEHVVDPRFQLTVTLTPRDGKTHLTWIQEFESAGLAERLRSICEPANEQNLDRLQAVLGEAERRP